jgi:glycerol kinase
MQFQADMAAVTVQRPTDVETTGRGAAMLAGIGAGLFRGLDEVARMANVEREFRPRMAEEERRAHLRRWESGLRRARSEDA